MSWYAVAFSVALYGRIANTAAIPEFAASLQRGRSGALLPTFF